MRKIILQVAISLDGYIEDKYGAFDWCFTDQDYGMSEFIERIDTLFMGRKTYDLMKSMPVDPTDEFSKKLAQIKQYVFSSQPNFSDPTVACITTDSIQWIKDYKTSIGQDIWLFGGAAFTSSLINHHLVDEIILAIHPILLGGGKPLISEQLERVPLSLLESKTFSSGLVMVHYQVRK